LVGQDQASGAIGPDAGADGTMGRAEAEDTLAPSLARPVG